MKRSLLFFNALFVCLISQASPLAESPRHIPFADIRPPATDLVYQGQVLFPSDAIELKKKGVDISQLNPQESDIWKNSPTATPQLDVLPLENGATVQFVEVVASPLKYFRFNVMAQDPKSGISQMHTILLGKKTQTLLLRKALLRRLGYQIPSMKRLSKLTVQFSSSIAKVDFVENRSSGLKLNADGDKEWILNLDDKNSNRLEMQDVVVLPVTSDITNVAEGFLEPLIQGRRSINALMIPFNMVDFGESINGLRWSSCQISQNAIFFPLQDNEEFKTPIDDAKWITRKILQLSRKDYVDIVKEAEIPHPADALLVEKLISRRNKLRKCLSLDGQDLQFNPQITIAPDLIEGELTRTEFEGFGARFALGEAESPIAPKELVALFKSKAIGTAIDELISKVNTDILPFTSPAKIAINKQRDELTKDLIEFIKTGKPRARDFGIWSKPYFQGQLIASREVVAGSYLGTDNRISLVDTFGVAADTGLALGTVGLSPNKLITGQAGVTYLRQYAHVRPLDSVKSALDEPYRNIIVPLVKRDMAKVIPTGLAAEFEKLDYEQQVKRAKEIVDVFKNELHDGESIIITESVGPTAAIQAGFDLGKALLFDQRIALQAALRAQQQIISRLHLLRVGEKIHVYKDRGNIKSVSFVVALQANIEILSIRAKFTKGTAQTAFYETDINPNQDHKDLIMNLAALRDVLMKSSITKLKSQDEPDVLEHKIKESQGEINFLVWNFLSLKQSDRIKVTRANETHSEYYIRSLRGERNGQDFQTLSINILNELIAEALGGSVKVSNPLTGDPGDTLFGKSHARYSYFEGEVNPALAPQKETFKEKFVGVIYRWRGWSAEKAKLKKITDEFSKRYQFQFYDQNAFSLIDKAQLYTLTLRVFVYEKGLNYIMQLPATEIEKIFEAHFRAKSKIDLLSKRVDALNSFYAFKRNYLQALKSGNTQRAADQLTQLVSLLEASLDKDGLVKIVGGPKNILIQSVLQGFLKGEDGGYAKIPVESNQIGEFGSANFAGPLTTLQMDLGMTESEFFVYWLLRRI